MEINLFRLALRAIVCFGVVSSPDLLEVLSVVDAVLEVLDYEWLYLCVDFVLKWVKKKIIDNITPPFEGRA